MPPNGACSSAGSAGSGFGVFSFRESAADVGIKSCSVHYHYPTKEDLAAAVIRRWAEETSKFVEEELQKDPDPVRAWTNAFRGTALSEGRMCPCTALGAASQDLPPEVAREVKGFFKMCSDKLVAEGLSPSNAAEVWWTIAGALVCANALGETAAYDHATSDLLRQREALRSARRGVRAAGKAADLRTGHAARRAPRPL